MYDDTTSEIELVEHQRTNPNIINIQTNPMDGLRSVVSVTPSIQRVTNTQNPYTDRKYASCATYLLAAILIFAVGIVIRKNPRTTNIRRNYYVPNRNSPFTNSAFGSSPTTSYQWFDNAGICHEEECTNSARDILAWMNHDVNPCEDFYEYACGNWEEFNRQTYTKKNEMVEIWDNFDKLTQTAENLLHEMLTEYFDNDYNLKKIRQFYEKCIRNGESGIVPFLQNVSDILQSRRENAFYHVINKGILKPLRDHEGSSHSRNTISDCQRDTRIRFHDLPLSKMYAKIVNFNKNLTKQVTEMMGNIQSALIDLYRNSQHPIYWIMDRTLPEVPWEWNLSLPKPTRHHRRWTIEDIIEGYRLNTRKDTVINNLRIIKPCIGISPTLYKISDDNEELLSRIDQINNSKTGVWIKPKCFWISPPFKPKAIFNFIGHSIEVTAALLQSPFLNTHRPSAMNYGSIGSILGHELAHSVETRYFFENAILGPATLCLEEQYGQFFVTLDKKMEINNVSATPGILHLNGTKTFAENFSDLVGLLASYKAFKILTTYPQYATMELPGLEHFTSDQLFFLGFAHTWCSIQSPEILAYQIKTDTHSPNKFRVLGVLRNSYDFQYTWNCHQGSLMNPIRKCVLL